MSAMPARAPQVAPRTARPVQVKNKNRSARKRAQSSWKQVVVPAFTPALETLNVSLPKAKSSKRAFSYLVSVLIVGGMLLSGYVNTMAASASFEKRQLSIELSDLTAQQQQLERQVALQESPAHLINVARKMGMVPAGSPAFIRLSDHKILGHPELARKGR